jgi:CRISPR-associated protein Cst1
LEEIKKIGKEIEIKKISEDKKQCKIIILSISEYYSFIKKILSKYNIDYFRSTLEFSGTPRDILKNIFKELKNIEEERKIVFDASKKLYIENLWLYVAFDYLSILKSKKDIERYIKQTKKVIIIEGWILEKDLNELKNKLYKKFSNISSFYKEKEKVCRLSGYYIDKGRKIKSLSYNRNKNSFMYEDDIIFDFIPFAFSKTRESLFINNNYTIDQLVRTNKHDIDSDDEKKYYAKLFSNTKKASSFIDYEVEIILKDENEEFFKTLYIRNEAIEIFKKIDNDLADCLYKNVRVNNSVNEANNWFSMGKFIINSILNDIKLDNIINYMLKNKFDHKYLVSRLIRVNVYIYDNIYDSEEGIMKNGQKAAYAAALEVRKALAGKKNKIDAYEKRLISAISLRDYNKVQEILLHLSSYTQVRMNFLIDIFEDFEKNKNLVYTFINVLGNKTNGGNNEK